MRTAVAAECPGALAAALAWAAAEAAGLWSDRRRLDLAVCARCAPRIGEAQHPGPACKRANSASALAVVRAARRQARSTPLLQAQLVEPATAAQQETAVHAFERWLHEECCSPVALPALTAVPPLLDRMVQAFGAVLQDRGEPMYRYLF